MRIIKCGSQGCAGQPVLLPSGRPYALGRPPDAFPFTVRCVRCRRTTSIDAGTYWRLPEVDPTEVVERIT